MRSLPLVLLASSLLGCPVSEPDVLLTTTGGHIVDQRAWAVGARIGVSASWMTGEPGQMGFRTESGESLTREAGAWRDGAFAGPSMGAGYASRSGIVDRAEAFDVVVVDALGRPLSSTPLVSEEIDDVRLGVALDDCPEFADVVLPPDVAFVEGTDVLVYPAPVDADGNHLLGGLDFNLTTDGLTLPYGVGGDFGMGEGAVNSYPMAVTMDSDGGDLAFEIAGAQHPFAVRTVRLDEIVGLGLDVQAEKHGFEDEALLTVFGRTADGQQVFGVQAAWSNGGVATWAHGSEGVELDACVGELCVTWDGAPLD